MIKPILTTLILTFSISSAASSFGTLPSQVFGPKGTLTCSKKERCALPESEQLQAVAEEFLNYSPSRLEALDKIEAEILFASQAYELAVQELFNNRGNAQLKKFLQTGRDKHIKLLDSLDLSAARQLVGGSSLFLIELMALEETLRDADVDIINSKNKDATREATEQKIGSYINFRASAKFHSYKKLDKVKALHDLYRKSKSLAPWIKANHKPLKLNFNSCPSEIRKTVKALRPSVKYDLVKSPLQFDYLNSKDMVKSLINNGFLLSVTCSKKERGNLEHSFDVASASVKLYYRVNNSGKFKASPLN